MKIFKYPIIKNSDVLELPSGAVPLSVGEQDGSIVLWALVDENAPKRKYKFDVVWTGWEYYGLGNGMEFLGTVQMSNGLVNHIFYNKTPV